MRAGGFGPPLSMTKRLLDRDPDSGMETWFDYDPVDDTFTLSYQDQNTESFLDVVRTKRNNAQATKNGIRKGMWHYASLPPVVIMQLRAKGIDVFNKGHEAAMLREIDANYPYCKTTDKRHLVRG